MSSAQGKEHETRGEKKKSAHLVLHLETLLKLDTPPPREARMLLVSSGVALVDEEAREAACTAVEVLVRAPRREVDVPVVEVHRNIPRCVGKIPPNNNRRCTSGRRGVDGVDVRRDGGYIKILAGEVLEPGEEDEGEPILVRVDRRDDRLGWDDPTVH